MKLWIKHCCSCGARWLPLNKAPCVCASFVSPASESESDVSPEKRARVSGVPEDEESSSSSSSFSALSSSSSSSRSGSKQRSRKRCHRCQTKLELVQQELGSCRCGKTFRHKHALERARGNMHRPTHTHRVLVALIHDFSCVSHKQVVTYAFWCCSEKHVGQLDDSFVNFTSSAGNASSSFACVWVPTDRSVTRVLLLALGDHYRAWMFRTAHKT